jgi:uncharacterized protein (TIGR03435 family)
VKTATLGGTSTLPTLDNAPPEENLTLFDALKKQLGLELDLRHMPVTFLRIDAASGPVLN